VEGALGDLGLGLTSEKIRELLRSYKQTKVTVWPQNLFQKRFQKLGEKWKLGEYLDYMKTHKKDTIRYKIKR